MADISIEEAKAKLWIADVNDEIYAVEVILKKVNGALTSGVATDDSIMNGIIKIGEAMENAWSKLCDAMKKSQNKVEEAISKVVAAGQSVIDDADSLKSKIGQ